MTWADDQAALLKVLAEPTRLRIATELAKAPASVAEVGEVLGLSRHNLYHHFTALVEAGVVEAFEVGGRGTVYRYLPDGTGTAEAYVPIFNARSVALAMETLREAGASAQAIAPASGQRVNCRRVRLAIDPGQWPEVSHLITTHLDRLAAELATLETPGGADTWTVLLLSFPGGAE